MTDKKKDTTTKKSVEWSKSDGYYVVKNYKPAPSSDADIVRYTRDLLKKAAR